MGQSLPLAQREQIVALYKSGYSYRDISDQLSLAYTTVRGICQFSDQSLDGNLRPNYDRCGRKASPMTAVWQRRSK